MQWIKNLFTSLRRYFANGKAAQDAQMALEFVARAMPFIVQTADLLVTLTATPLDDALWAAIKAKYPEVFAAGPLTGDALRRAGLQIAAAEIRKAYPQLDVSVSITTAQLAYLDYRAQQAPALAVK